MATLYIGDLAWEANESDINNLFSGFDIRTVHMKFGYCFVEFRDREQAAVGLALDGTELFGKRIRIEWARSSYGGNDWSNRYGDDWGGSPVASHRDDWGGSRSPVASHRDDWVGSHSPVPSHIQNRDSNHGEHPIIAVHTQREHAIISVHTQTRGPNLSNSSSSLASSASSQSIASSSCPPVTENTLLECEICFVRFDYTAHRPRSLPCGHSLCSLCISDTLKANLDSEFAEHPYLLCPFCRTSCGPHKTRVGQFPETFFILKMLEVEAGKGKKSDEKEKEEHEKKKKEREEKKKEEKKKEEERKEIQRKQQEEEYERFQKQMIGIDSTVSGIISCKDHLESLEDLHKEQVSVKCKLKTQRKKLLEEVRTIESEITELSDQMFNTEVWIASGKNLLTKFENIQEDLNKENNDENIESCYDAAERCCLATQIWSEDSLPEIEKMDLFIKQKQESSSGSMRPSGAASCDIPDQGPSVAFECAEGTDINYKSGEPERIKTKHHAITQMKEYHSTSFEELRVKYYLNRPYQLGSSKDFSFTQKCSTCCNKIVGPTAFGSQTMENNGVVELTEALGELNKLSENSLDADSGNHQSSQSSRRVLKRSKLGFLFEKTKEIQDTDTEPEISSAEPTESISRAFPFVETNTTPSFNFGSTINPFQRNVLGATTAVTPINLSPRVSTLSVASILPTSAVETTSSIGSSTQLTLPVTSTIGKSNVSLTQIVSSTANSTTFSTFLTNTAKSRVNTTSTSSVVPLSSRCVTSTVSSLFSKGNLFQTSATGASSIPTSVVDAAKQITTEAFSFVSNSSASVRPKVNSACGLTSALTSFPIISKNNLSQSESSLCLSTSFAEQKDLSKKCSITSSMSSAPLISTNNLSQSESSLCPTSFADQKDLSKKSSSMCSDGGSATFSGFKFVNSIPSDNRSAAINSTFFTLPTTAFATNVTTVTSTNTTASASVSKSLSLVSSPSSSPLPVRMPDVKDVETMTSVLNTLSTKINSRIDNIFNKPTTCSHFSNTNVTLNCSTASSSVRPKIFPTTTSEVLGNDSDSKYSSINSEDDRKQQMTTKDCKLSTELSCDNETTKSLPSFTFTMSPGKFSGISFAPLTSTNTKTTNSENGQSSAGLSFTNSMHTTTAPTSFRCEPISFCMKPKSFNFSLTGATKKVEFSDLKKPANSDSDSEKSDSSLPE